MVPSREHEGPFWDAPVISTSEKFHGLTLLFSWSQPWNKEAITYLPLLIMPSEASCCLWEESSVSETIAHPHSPRNFCSSCQPDPNPLLHRPYASEPSGPPEGNPGSCLPMPSYRSLLLEYPSLSLTSKSQPCQGLVNGYVPGWVQRRAIGAHERVSGKPPWDLSLELQGSSGLDTAPDRIINIALLFDLE